MSTKQKNHVTFILLMAFFYLICGFVRWDWNAGHWNEDTRYIYGFLGTLVSALITFVASQIEKENKQNDKMGI
jgi:hypothetical protein